ncbi:hypothetical protein [Bacillus sp. AK128]
MTLTKKVCFYILMGSFLSWGIWIIIEILNGKGFQYNSSGLLFGLILTSLAFLIYYLYFNLKKQGIIFGILTVCGLFSITMFVVSYFTSSGH